MRPVFVQFRCEPGKTYQVAEAIYDREIVSELYSTSGDFDLLANVSAQALGPVPDATEKDPDGARGAGVLLVRLCQGSSPSVELHPGHGGSGGTAWSATPAGSVPSLPGSPAG